MSSSITRTTTGTAGRSGGSGRPAPARLPPAGWRWSGSSCSGCVARRTVAERLMTTGGPADRVVPMDGIHDLGGRQGFGTVAHSPAEAVFPDQWQATARALMEVV